MQCLGGGGYIIELVYHTKNKLQQQQKHQLCTAAASAGLTGLVGLGETTQILYKKE